MGNELSNLQSSVAPEEQKFIPFYKRYSNEHFAGIQQHAARRIDGATAPLPSYSKQLSELRKWAVKLAARRLLCHISPEVMRHKKK